MPAHANRYRNPLHEFTGWLLWRAVAALRRLHRAPRRLGRIAVQTWGDLTRPIPADEGISPRWLTAGFALVLAAWALTLAVRW